MLPPAAEKLAKRVPLLPLTTGTAAHFSNENKEVGENSVWNS